MEKINFGSVRQTVFNGLPKKTNKPAENTKNTQDETKQDNKKLRLALAVLGATGSVIAAGLLIRQNKTHKLKEAIISTGSNLTDDGKKLGAVIEENITNIDRQGSIKQEAMERLERQHLQEINAERTQTIFDECIKVKHADKSAKDSAMAILTRKTKNSSTMPVFDEEGNYIKSITTTKKGIQTEEFFDDGKLIKRITQTPDRRYETTIENGTKIVDMDGGDISGFKLYTEEAGKFKKVGREYHDYSRDYHKTVEQLDNGVSKTVVDDGYEETITFRDKKGKVIDFETKSKRPSGGDFGPDDIGPLDPGAEKIYERWYINYAKLCKKYGVLMRPCGVEGGAWSHYYELLQREKGPEAWDSYLQLEEYRSQYDEKARLMQFLREFGSEDVLKSLGFSKEDIDILIKMDAKSLKKLIKAMQEENLSAKDVMSNMAEILERQKNYGYENVEDAVEETLKRMTYQEAPVESSWYEECEDAFAQVYQEPVQQEAAYVFA